MIDVVEAKSSAELDAVKKIRKQVFVVEQRVPEALEWEHDLESTYYLAAQAGVAVGCGRFRQTRAGYKIERMAVMAESRGLGVGAAILRRMLLELKVRDETQIYLNAQETAVRFYEKFGFRIAGDRFVEAGIGHFRMVKQLD